MDLFGKTKKFLHPYYLGNLLLVVLYPLHRWAGLDHPKLHQKDWIGYSREVTVVITFVLFAVLRYKKYSNSQHMLVSVLLYGKVCVAALYWMVHPQLVMLYAILAAVFWLVLRMPVHRGPNRFIKIMSKVHFEQEVLGIDSKTGKTRFKDRKKVVQVERPYEELEMSFIEFWAPFAETCLYTRSIWSEYSRKYSSPSLKYYEVNVQQLPEMAKDYGINMSGVSRQLPTLIMLENGAEICRFPPINEEGKIGKVLKYDNRKLAQFFDLERRALETMTKVDKKNPGKFNLGSKNVKQQERKK